MGPIKYSPVVRILEKVRLSGMRGYLLLFCLGPWLGGCAEPQRLEVGVGDALVEVEVADTGEARRRGLMFRQQLGEDQGMLFVFPGERVRQMWMLNTSIPLDAGFFDADGVLVNWVSMLPDGGSQIHSSTAPAHYVLEVNHGWFERTGITPGARLRLPQPIEAR